MNIEPEREALLRFHVRLWRTWKGSPSQVPCSSLGLNHRVLFFFQVTIVFIPFSDQKPCQIQGFSRRSTEGAGGRLGASWRKSSLDFLPFFVGKNIQWHGACTSNSLLRSKASAALRGKSWAVVPAKTKPLGNKLEVSGERMRGCPSCLLSYHPIYEKSSTYTIIFKNHPRRRGFGPVLEEANMLPNFGSGKSLSQIAPNSSPWHHK